jgi:hypothetical protein
MQHLYVWCNRNTTLVLTTCMLSMSAVMWAYLLPALLCLLPLAQCLEHDSLDCHLQPMPGPCHVTHTQAADAVVAWPGAGVSAMQ